MAFFAFYLYSYGLPHCLCDQRPCMFVFRTPHFSIRVVEYWSYCFRLLKSMRVCPWSNEVQVSQYLRSKKWDTRVAAAHAIGAIAENVKHMSLTELSSSVEAKMLEGGISATFDDVVALPNWHSRTGASTSFRRFFFIYAICIYFIASCSL